MNDQLSRSAETAAAFLDEHELPDLACVEITPDRVNGATRTTFQLAANVAELVDLVAFADTLTDVSVTVLRRHTPHSFTSVEVHGSAVDIPVTVWTHPGDRDLSALWDAVGHVPEYDVRARVELDTLRAAAESTSDAESAA